MTTPVYNPGKTEGCGEKKGFTLIELMVTVALLAVIILGLVAMFNQTQRAFTSSLTQVDVLEAGRAAADMIGRDLEQIAPAYFTNAHNNFSVLFPVANYFPSLVQQLPDPSDQWTNVMQELFFLTRNNNNPQWTGIGYRMDNVSENNAVGTLYRYYRSGITATNFNNNSSNVVNQLNIFSDTTWTNPNLTNNVNRIIDGVVDFRVLAYDTNGVLFTLTNSAVKPRTTYNIWSNAPGNYTYYFGSNALPAYVVVELGILETHTLERYRALTNNPAVAQNYLRTNAVGHMHIFRQRIPIRNVDPTAYQ